MTFPFVYVCDLLDDLERIHVREVPLLRKDRDERTRERICAWLQQHRRRLNSLTPHDSAAVLSMLWPEKQVDREYDLAEHMEQILARIFCLPSARFGELQRWRDDAHNHGDLGKRLGLIMDDMQIGSNRAEASALFVRDIDQALLHIAAFSKLSSSAVQDLAKSWDSAPDRIEVLHSLYKQTRPRDAKWLTRIIEKSYGPVQLPHDLKLASNLSNLPNCLQVSIKLPDPVSSAVRREGTGMITGDGWAGPMNLMPTSPTSSLLAKPSPKKATADGLHQDSFLPRPNPTPSQPRQTTVARHLPTPATSSPLPPLPTPHVSRSPSATAERRPRRFRISLNPASPTGNRSTPPISSLAQSSASGKPRFKITRILSPPKSTASRPLSTISPSIQIRVPPRSALGQISANVPSGGSQTSQPKSHTTSQAKATSQPKSRPNSQPGPSSPVTFSSGKCKLATPCKFANCFFILAPCVSGVPYIREDLIPLHGGHSVTSLSSLSHPSVPRRTKSGRRIKKYILVESHRPEKSVEFCKQAEMAVRKLGWKVKNGNREHIEILDWRVLEAYAKVDRGQFENGGLWKKHCLGTI